MNSHSETAQKAYHFQMQLRWSDQDLLGHVNNARVVTLAEEARIRADAAWFPDSPKGGSRVVRTQRIDFDAPILYGHTLDISVWVGHIGRTSFTLVHDLWQQGRRCALVEAVMVEVDAETGRPVVINDQDRQIFQRHLIER